jgi:DNA invertase Pin-like site-specific DNA recombinase
LVVRRLGRLGRTAKGLTSLFEDLIRWKVNLVSLMDGLDLVTPAGQLMANILAGVAAYETAVRAERILAGQAAVRTWAAPRWPVLSQIVAAPMPMVRLNRLRIQGNLSCKD